MARPLRLLCTVLSVVLLAGCGDEGTSSRAGASDTGLVVVTTVSPITSIASNVIGDLAAVHGVVPEGTNSHTYEPPPSVAELLADADVVFANGLQLEEPTLALARDVTDAPVVELGELIVSPDDHIFDASFPEQAGRPNPHLWTDPTLAREYARHVARTMSQVDPGNAGAYRANAEAFRARVDEFDRALRTALATVPEDHRKLVTYHDAYAYWARTYGWTVIAAAQPADFGDPSPRSIAALIDQIRAEAVPAVFGSEVFPSTVLEQVARETGAAYVPDLRDDDLPGAPGEREHSYLGLMRFDYVTIVEALGGDASALRAFEVADVVPDVASYPQ